MSPESSENGTEIFSVPTHASMGVIEASAEILVHRFHETNMLGGDSHDATEYSMAAPGQLDRC
jgi:hypothetical protein